VELLLRLREKCGVGEGIERRARRVSLLRMARLARILVATELATAHAHATSERGGAAAFHLYFLFVLQCSPLFCMAGDGCSPSAPCAPLGLAGSPWLSSTSSGRTRLGRTCLFRHGGEGGGRDDRCAYNYRSAAPLEPRAVAGIGGGKDAAKGETKGRGDGQSHYQEDGIVGVWAA